MAFAAPQPTRKHAALSWLIRGTGAWLALSGALLVLSALIFLPVFFRASSHPAGLSAGFRILMMFSVLIVVLFYGIIAKIGYDMFCKISAATVANFSFVFSFLLARIFYHLLPWNLPNVLAQYVGDHTPFFGQGHEPGISYRGTLAFLAFLLLYKITQTIFLRVLELDQSRRLAASSAPVRPILQ